MKRELILLLGLILVLNLGFVFAAGSGFEDAQQIKLDENRSAIITNISSNDFLNYYYKYDGYKKDRVSVNITTYCFSNDSSMYLQVDFFNSSRHEVLVGAGEFSYPYILNSFVNYTDGCKGDREGMDFILDSDEGGYLKIIPSGFGKYSADIKIRVYCIDGDSGEQGVCVDGKWRKLGWWERLFGSKPKPSVPMDQSPAEIDPSKSYIAKYDVSYSGKFAGLAQDSSDTVYHQVLSSNNFRNRVNSVRADMTTDGIIIGFFDDNGSIQVTSQKTCSKGKCTVIGESTLSFDNMMLKEEFNGDWIKNQTENIKNNNFVGKEKILGRDTNCYQINVSAATGEMRIYSCYTIQEPIVLMKSKMDSDMISVNQVITDLKIGPVDNSVFSDVGETNAVFDVPESEKPGVFSIVWGALKRVKSLFTG